MVGARMVVVKVETKAEVNRGLSLHFENRSIAHL